MTKKKVDLKSDPKFLARVAKIEGNATSTLLHKAVRIDLEHGPVFVKAIGLNDSYLLVKPLLDDDDDSGSYHLSVTWSKNTQGTVIDRLHANVSNVMVNWAMMSTPTETYKVAHRDIDIVKVAIDTIIQERGRSYFESLGRELQIVKQGQPVTIPNPFHKDSHNGRTR